MVSIFSFFSKKNSRRVTQSPPKQSQPLPSTTTTATTTTTTTTTDPPDSAPPTSSTAPSAPAQPSNPPAPASTTQPSPPRAGGSTTRFLSLRQKRAAPRYSTEVANKRSSIEYAPIRRSSKRAAAAPTSRVKPFQPLDRFAFEARAPAQPTDANVTGDADAAEDGAGDRVGAEVLGLENVGRTPRLGDNERKELGAQRFTVAEASRGIQVLGEELSQQGGDTIGIMLPRRTQADLDIQRYVLTLFSLTIRPTLSTSFPSVTLTASTSDWNSRFVAAAKDASPVDLAEAFKWIVRRIDPAPARPTSNPPFSEPTSPISAAWVIGDLDNYVSFVKAEHARSYPLDAYAELFVSTIQPEAASLLNQVLDVVAAIALHADVNLMSAGKVCHLLGWWLLGKAASAPVLCWQDLYDGWKLAGKRLEHLFYARIRWQSTLQRIPLRLQQMVDKYPFGVSSASSDHLPLPPPSSFSRRTLHVVLGSAKDITTLSLSPFQLVEGATTCEIEGEVDQWAALRGAVGKDSNGLELLDDESRLYLRDTSDTALASDLVTSELARSFASHDLDLASSVQNQAFTRRHTRRRSRSYGELTRSGSGGLELSGTSPVKATLEPLAEESSSSSLAKVSVLGKRASLNHLRTTTDPTPSSGPGWADFEKLGFSETPADYADLTLQFDPKKTEAKASTVRAPVTPPKATVPVLKLNKYPGLAVVSETATVIDDSFLAFTEDGQVDSTASQWPSFALVRLNQSSATAASSEENGGNANVITGESRPEWLLITVELRIKTFSSYDTLSELERSPSPGAHSTTSKFGSSFGLRDLAANTFKRSSSTASARPGTGFRKSLFGSSKNVNAKQKVAGNGSTTPLVATPEEGKDKGVAGSEGDKAKDASPVGSAAPTEYTTGEMGEVVKVAPIADADEATVVGPSGTEITPQLAGPVSDTPAIPKTPTPYDGLTTETAPEDWTYFSEGGLHVVFAYTGSNPTFIGRVLRFIKSAKTASAAQDAWEHKILPRLLDPDLLVPASTVRLSDETWLHRLLEAAEDSRPLHRKEGAKGSGERGEESQPNSASTVGSEPWTPVDAGSTLVQLVSANAQIMPTLTGAIEGHRVVTFEIKPKWGFLPPSTTLSPPESVAIKTTNCRFCMHQHLRGQLDGRDHVYCPLDLYSGDKARMGKAIEGLWEGWEVSAGEKNNLRVFVDGERVGPIEVEKIPTAQPGQDIAGGTKNFLIPLLLSTHVLPALARLQSRLDPADISRLAARFATAHPDSPLFSPDLCPEPTATELTAFIDSYNSYLSSGEGYSATDAAEGAEAWTLRTTMIAYALSAIFKDCSVFVRAVLAQHPEYEGEYILNEELSEVKVIDLDLKPLKSLKKWYDLDEKIWRHWAETKPAPQVEQVPQDLYGTHDDHKTGGNVSGEEVVTLAAGVTAATAATAIAMQIPDPSPRHDVDDLSTRAIFQNESLAPSPAPATPAQASFNAIDDADATEEITAADVSTDSSSLATPTRLGTVRVVPASMLGSPEPGSGGDVEEVEEEGYTVGGRHMSLADALAMSDDEHGDQGEPERQAGEHLESVERSESPMSEGRPMEFETPLVSATTAAAAATAAATVAAAGLIAGAAGAAISALSGKSEDEEETVVEKEHVEEEQTLVRNEDKGEAKEAVEEEEVPEIKEHEATPPPEHVETFDQLAGLDTYTPASTGLLELNTEIQPRIEEGKEGEREMFTGVEEEDIEGRTQRSLAPSPSPRLVASVLPDQQASEPDSDPQSRSKSYPELEPEVHHEVEAEELPAKAAVQGKQDEVLDDAHEEIHEQGQEEELEDIHEPQVLDERIHDSAELATAEAVETPLTEPDSALDADSAFTVPKAPTLESTVFESAGPEGETDEVSHAVGLVQPTQPEQGHIPTLEDDPIAPTSSTEAIAHLEPVVQPPTEDVFATPDYEVEREAPTELDSQPLEFALEDFATPGLQAFAMRNEDSEGFFTAPTATPAEAVESSELIAPIEPVEPVEAFETTEAMEAAVPIEPIEAIETPEVPEPIDVPEPEHEIEPESAIEVPEPESTIDVPEPKPAIEDEPESAIDFPEPAAALDVIEPEPAIDVPEIESAIHVPEAEQAVEEPEPAFDLVEPTQPLDISHPVAIDASEPETQLFPSTESTGMISDNAPATDPNLGESGVNVDEKINQLGGVFSSRDEEEEEDEQEREVEGDAQDQEAGEAVDEPQEAEQVEPEQEQELEQEPEPVGEPKREAHVATVDKVEPEVVDEASESAHEEAPVEAEEAEAEDEVVPENETASAHLVEPAEEGAVPEVEAEKEPEKDGEPGSKADEGDLEASEDEVEENEKQPEQTGAHAEVNKEVEPNPAKETENDVVEKVEDGQSPVAPPEPEAAATPATPVTPVTPVAPVEGDVPEDEDEDEEAEAPATPVLPVTPAKEAGEAGEEEEREREQGQEHIEPERRTVEDLGEGEDEDEDGEEPSPTVQQPVHIIPEPQPEVEMEPEPEPEAKVEEAEEEPEVSEQPVPETAAIHEPHDEDEDEEDESDQVQPSAESTTTTTTTHGSDGTEVVMITRMSAPSASATGTGDDEPEEDGFDDMDEDEVEEGEEEEEGSGIQSVPSSLPPIPSSIASSVPVAVSDSEPVQHSQVAHTSEDLPSELEPSKDSVDTVNSHSDVDTRDTLDERSHDTEV